MPVRFAETVPAAGSTVYIMPEGSSYHRTKNCSAIVSYVRQLSSEKWPTLVPALIVENRR